MVPVGDPRAFRGDLFLDLDLLCDPGGDLFFDLDLLYRLPYLYTAHLSHGHMIRLIDILFETPEHYDKGQVWITPHELYGAKSSTGDIRYFTSREDAAAFASGKIKPPVPGRPEPKAHVQHHEPVQKYTAE